jgi:NifB/MoaA-like Fe-S oxidoreductase
MRTTSDARPVTIVTGELGARVLEPLLPELRARSTQPVRVLPVANDFFGGNIAVTGLLTGADVARALAGEPAGDRYLLPDVTLSRGRFLDGTDVDALPRPVEVVPTDGASLVRALV